MKKPFKGEYKLSQGFGNKLILNGVDIYAKFGLKGHNGNDYALPTGTEVVASHAGVVVGASSDPNGYGLYIKLENSIEGSIYAHLKEFKVKVGDSVSEGQLIGISDNTGNSTGSHLHYGYYRIPRDKTNGYAGYIDPKPFLNQTSEGMVTLPQKELDEIRNRRDQLYNERKQVTTALEFSDDTAIDTIVKSINAYKGNANKAEELEKQLNSIEIVHKQEIKEISDKNDRVLFQKEAVITELNATIFSMKLTKEQMDRTVIALEKELKEVQEENRKLKSDNPCPSFLEMIIKIFKK